jgi:SAM-dependent methyltransferase
MDPLLYHTHNSLSSDDLDFWLGLVKRQPGAILELGCGTGRVLSHLVQASAPIYGLDHDFAMLKFLKNNIPLLLLPKVHIFQGDFTRFHLGLRFDQIILACNTYSTLTDRHRAEMLECVQHHLHSKGIFTASMPNPIALTRLPRKADLEVEEIFPHPADGEPVQVSSRWSRSKSQMTITWVYDCLRPDGSVDRLQYEVLQHIIPIEKILSEFQSAGLEVTEMYGEFDGSPFSDDSSYLILVSNKMISGEF